MKSRRIEDSANEKGGGCSPHGRHPPGLFVLLLPVQTQAGIPAIWTGSFATVFDQFFDHARIGQGGDVTQVACVLLGDFPENTAHDLA